MPWDAASFAAHNHHLSPAQSGHAARIANAILGRGASEGIAIATANKLVQHRDIGGGVDPTTSGIGGVTPSAQTMNPQTRAMVQRYASMPVEKLQELAAMMGGSQQGHVIESVLRQKQMQPQSQPDPVPQPQRRGGATQRDMGGGLSPSMATPWWTRSEARGEENSGFLHGMTAGRADAVKTSTPAGSYVLPADVVAGLGEGNSLAGARVMDDMLNSAPHGITPPRMVRGRGPPAPPRPSAAMDEAMASKGGAIGQETPVRLSHGEYVISPEQAQAIGGGDLKRGHRILDHFVVMRRKKTIEKMKKLPGPVKT